MLVIIDMPKIVKAKKVDIGVGGVRTQNWFFDIFDSKGNKVEYEILSSEVIRMGVEPEVDTKSIKFPAQRRRILIEATVPEMGYTTYAIRLRAPDYVKFPEHGPDRPLIARENGLLENEHLKVKINPNGTFSLYSKETKRLHEYLHYFTDNGEVGSAHISRKPQRNHTHTSLGSAAKITMIESNLLRGVYRIDLRMTIPAGATLDRRDRLREMIDLPITYWLTLEKGGKYLKIRTRLHNEARDHKLCVNFPTGIYTDYATAESAFAVEKRCVRYTQTGDNFESFYPFQPMQNFVDVNDGKMGLAFLSKGLREYEVADDKERTLAITLIRTHRAYMTANTDMTPEEFDKYTGLHSLGDMEYNYALYPHTGEWDSGEVLQAAYQHKVDIKAIQGVPIEGELPVTGSFLSIQPSSKIMLSALKHSEDGKGIIMRIWNTTSDKQNVTVATTLPIRSVKRLLLDETPVADVSFSEGKIKFEIEPHKIETLLLA